MKQALAGALLAASGVGLALPVMATESVQPGNIPATPRSEKLPSPLRLDEAIERAVDNNFAIRRARADVEAALGRERHASRWFPGNPELEMETARREDTRTGREQDDLGIRIAQEFWIGGQGGLMEAASEARSEKARARLGFLVTTTRARTRAVFLELLVAREAVATAERAVGVARDIQSFAQSRLEAGEATRLEVNTADIGVGRARAALAQAQDDLARANMVLAELLAVDPVAQLEIAGQLTARELELPGRQELLNRAVRRRHDLQAAASEVVAAQKDLQLSRRQLIPNLKVFGFYEEEEADEITGIGISLPLPLLHQFEGERQEAAAQYQAAQIDESAARFQVRREVLQAVASYRAARNRFQAVTDQMVQAAEENVELTYEAFRAGKVGAQAIASAQESLLEVRDSYLAAQRALIDAASELERATGGLLVMTNSSGARSNAAPKENTQ